jgi:hypothetical protein
MKRFRYLAITPMRMKKISIATVAALALVGSAALAVPASAATQHPNSVCQPDGTGCTAAGWYVNFPVKIYGKDGLLIMWTKTYVYPYSSGVPLYWYVGVEYYNSGDTIIYLSCPAGSAAGNDGIGEYMTGGDGNDGYVAAYQSTCSADPNWVASLGPGRSVETYAIFHNVPWPGTAVSIGWGQFGQSDYIHPFNQHA